MPWMFLFLSIQATIIHQSKVNCENKSGMDPHRFTNRLLSIMACKKCYSRQIINIIKLFNFICMVCYGNNASASIDSHQMNKCCNAHYAPINS